LHAYNTYDEFLKSNEEELKKLPPPKAAVEYYEKSDLGLFDSFHNGAFQEAMTANELPVEKAKGADGASRSAWERRRPILKNLYDVFVNIRDDEKEHVETMDNLERDVSKRILPQNKEL
jgi:ubiquinol oxidase